MSADDALEAFCWRLRTARRSRRLTQPDVAEAIGVTAVAVSQWELFRNRPTEASLRAWAEHLGVPVPAVVADAVRPTVACGTAAGYSRHLRRGEKTCPPCRAANAERYWRRKEAS